jgi:23S rRNA (uracil1939-C5)-methyltransferase
MAKNHITPFTVTSIDTLGQGVSKLSGKVTFIAKTMIGDEGEAQVVSERKGVIFARLKNLHKASSHRITPECIHFAQCPSCHFLHISYEEELKIKKESFQRLMRKMELPDVNVIGAPERFSYRNRIQLHYSLKSKLIGMRDPLSQTIIPIPSCKIAIGPVTQELTRLYQNDQWIKEAPRSPVEGHVEIYQHEGAVKVTWNGPYAAGGFSQVYELMNQKLKSTIKEEVGKLVGVLDLFGGNGNLSQNLNYSQRLCVDLYSSPQGADFFSQDLYHRNALSNVISEVKRRNLRLTHLLIDPPRSGLKDLCNWVSQFRPQHIIYVSCDPHTLARDLGGLADYSLKKAFVFDFFPSTFHFESLVILERKS